MKSAGVRCHYDGDGYGDGYAGVRCHYDGDGYGDGYAEVRCNYCNPARGRGRSDAKCKFRAWVAAEAGAEPKVRLWGLVMGSVQGLGSVL